MPSSPEKLLETMPAEPSPAAPPCPGRAFPEKEAWPARRRRWCGAGGGALPSADTACTWRRTPLTASSHALVEILPWIKGPWCPAAISRDSPYNPERAGWAATRERQLRFARHSCGCNGVKHIPAGTPAAERPVRGDRRPCRRPPPPRAPAPKPRPADEVEIGGRAQIQVYSRSSFCRGLHAWGAAEDDPWCLHAMCYHLCQRLFHGLLVGGPHMHCRCRCQGWRLHAHFPCLRANRNQRIRLSRGITYCT